ncbi:MAG TPA: SDR family oxidoreductase, partial [Candidatus Baltobacteraceae bacterium]|nr:SDR family oxidoreductase [Candidatus Baltobacteraceae bacterium]
LYGDDVLAGVRDHPGLRQIKGDIRNRADVRTALRDVTDVIHLACISNDPSFELDPGLGKSINYDCFPMLVDESKNIGVTRFIYASSSSVYGLREEENVTEELELRPLTDYSTFKAMCEEVLMEKRERGFSTLILRPATVCGYSSRLRLDLTVNILTNHAVTNRAIKVFGGSQMRPNIHIDDMTDLYTASLAFDLAAIDGKIYNAGYHNKQVIEIAKSVRDIVGEDVTIGVEPTDDNRSYHISSQLIKDEVGFEASRSIEDAVRDLKTAFSSGKIPGSMTDDRYYNIRTMQRVRLE